MKRAGHILTMPKISILILLCAASISFSDEKIDRRALVTRHNVTIEKPESLTPLSVGNGEFAFTADITGLQSFPEFHDKGTPLGTQSQWGWHSTPNTNNYKMSDVLTEYELAGRKVPYASDGGRSYSPAIS